VDIVGRHVTGSFDPLRVASPPRTSSAFGRLARRRARHRRDRRHGGQPASGDDAGRDVHLRRARQSLQFGIYDLKFRGGRVRGRRRGQHHLHVTRKKRAKANGKGTKPVRAVVVHAARGQGQPNPSKFKLQGLNGEQMGYIAPEFILDPQSKMITNLTGKGIETALTSDCSTGRTSTTTPARSRLAARTSA
jgi:hypothetical protein